MGSDKQFVEYVKNYVKEKYQINLPKLGVIGGQSIAELYFMFNELDIKTRIKDIDLFFLFGDHNFAINEDTTVMSPKSKERLDFLLGHFDGSLEDFKKYKLGIRKLHKFKVTKTSMTENFSFEEVALGLDRSCVYEKKSLLTKTLGLNIVRSFVSSLNDKLNITVYRYDSDVIDQDYDDEVDVCRALIESFDINAVQVGINLETGEVIKSLGFEKFLKDRYVEINDYQYKASSLLRYVEKSEYYEGAIFNFDQEFMRSYSSIERIEYGGFLRSRYNRLKDKSKKTIESYFETKDRDISIFIKNFSVRGFGEVDFAKIINEKEQYIKDINDSRFKLAVKMHPLMFSIISYEDFKMIEDKLYFCPDVFSRGCFDKVEFGKKLTLEDFKTLQDYSRIYYLNVIDHLDIVNKNKEWNLLRKKEEEIRKKVKKLLSYTKSRHKRDFLSKISMGAFFSDNPFEDSLNIAILKDLEITKVRFKNTKQLQDLNDKMNELGLNSRISRLTYRSSLIDWLNKKSVKNKIKHIFKDSNENIVSSFWSFASFCSHHFNDISIFNVKKEKMYNVFKHDVLAILTAHHYYLNSEQWGNFAELFNLVSDSVTFLEKNRYGFIIGFIESEKLPFEALFFNSDEVEEMKSKLNLNRETKFKVNGIDGFRKKGVFIKQLVTRMDLIEEGELMNHCIGGASLTNGDMHFFMINKKKKERVTFTISAIKRDGMVKICVSEAKKRFNGAPSKESIGVISEFSSFLSENKIEELRKPLLTVFPNCKIENYKKKSFKEEEVLFYNNDGDFDDEIPF